MIKSLKKNDIRTTPFTAAKKWNPQNKLHKDLILWQSGSVSGSLSLTFKEYNDGTVAPYTYISSAIALQQQQEDFLRFREGVNLSGSISPTGSFYYDPVLSEKNVDGTYKTVLYATTKHLFYKESQDPSKIFGLESLDSSNVNRSLPNKISTFNIPQNKFGEKVIPKSVVITHEIQGQTYNVVDDGNSNLVVSDKTFINNQDANIDKVPANIILNGLPTSEGYDGQPFAITATTKPSNLAYIVTYNGSTTPPTNAGTYTVVATIDDNFYAASTTSTFIIEKTPRIINISNLSQSYDGNPKPVTVSTPLIKVNYTVTYNGSTTPPTNAGTYTVLVTINDLNYKNLPKDLFGDPGSSGLATLIIVPQTLTITSQCPPSKTYGDEDFTIPVNTVSNGAISYTINSGPATIVNGKIHITGVGTLNVTITQAASGNYSAATVNCSSITISAKPLTVTGITAADKAYNGDITATLNTSNAALQGVVINPINELPDVVTLNVVNALGEFLSDLPGEGKTVAILGLTIEGADNGKYTLVQPTTTAAIKAGSASGTITMNSATVTYNGKPQSLGVSISDPNIPIKITYSVNNNVIILVKLYKGIPTISSGQYPKDIGKYTVTAELDDIISTAVKYTVPTVTATLEIKPIQGNVTFGSNIFYYDGKPKPVILSQSPVGEDLTITYNGSSTIPSTPEVYKVNVKFINPNIFYDNTVDLKIKNIPTVDCGVTINNTQQEQKNIIDFTNSDPTGKVNFNYSVALGKSQFTIEYPLNSGKEVYNSGLISTSDSNPQISFDKIKTDINANPGWNFDKCLITVSSPTDNNTWKYSISCVNAPAPMISTPQGVSIVVFSDYRSVAPGGTTWGNNVDADFLGSNLSTNLTGKLEAELKAGNLTQSEFNAIKRIFDNNSGKVFVNRQSVILEDTTTNIKINIMLRTFDVLSGNGLLAIMRYDRLADSFLPKKVSGPNVSDCHYFKYNGVVGLPFDITGSYGAKAQLTGQINSDSFKNTFVSSDPLNDKNRTNGYIQQSLLIKFVEVAITNTSIDNAKFRFEKGKVVISNKIPNTVYPIDMPNGLPTIPTNNEGYISINPTLQTIQIIYPADCKL
jgi:hypothetical protein